MDKQTIIDIERGIIFRLCDSALWKSEEEWQEIAKTADKLLSSTYPLSRWTEADLHRCIAYAASQFESVNTTDKAGAERQAEIFVDFWACVAELARRKLWRNDR